MFQNLRNQSQLYVFYKDANPHVEIGIVKDIAKTPQNQAAMPIMVYAQPPRIDDTLTLTVSVNGQDLVFPQVPYMSDSMDYPSKGLFISDSRDAVNAEVSSYQKISEHALSDDTRNYHMSIISGCKAIREKLNPEFAAQQAQQIQIDELNKKLDALISMMNMGSGTTTSKKSE